MVRWLITRVRTRYRRSWAGQNVHMTKGLLLIEAIALLSLVVSVPYLVQENASADQRREERSQLVDNYRDCVRRAVSGADLQATTLESVNHAEATADLMRAISDILTQAAPNSRAVAAIRVKVDEYVQGVAEFRQVTENYTPTPMAECDHLPGAALVDQ